MKTLLASIALILSPVMAFAAFPRAPRNYFVDAERAISSIPDQYHRDRARSELVKETIKSGNPDLAETFAREIETSHAKADALIRVTVSRAARGDAEKAINEISELARDADDASAEEWGLYALAKALAAAGDLKGAELACDRIEGISGSGYYVTAKTEIASGLARRGDIKSASAIVDGFPDACTKARGYCDIGDAQAKAGDAKGALASYSKAKDIALRQPQGRARDELLSAVAESQALAHDMKAAFDTAAAIKDSFWRNMAYEGIGLIQARAGGIAGALQTTKLMSDPAMTAVLYTFIAAAQQSAGKTAAAAKMLDDAGQLAARIDVTKPSMLGPKRDETRIFRYVRNITDQSTIFTAIALAQARLGDAAAAEAAIAKVKDEDVRLNAYYVLAAALIENGHDEAAHKTCSRISDPELRCWFMIGEGAGKAALTQSKTKGTPPALPIDHLGP